MRVIRRISAVLIGFVFFLAGVLKIMDPVGARLVVEEYLKFLHLGWMTGLAGVIASGMALLEALVGAALITGVWRKVAGIVAGAMTAFFTLLTFFLYLKNPHMDCGCFGEMIHLTHLQTLIKNLILLALWAIAFLPFSKLEPTRKVKYVSFPIAALSVCGFLLYSSLTIPLVDFTPFKPGAELMLDKLKPQQWDKVVRLLQDAAASGYKPMVLAASTPTMMRAAVSAPEVLDATYFADRKKLLTLNRSNGGATYIQDGLIVTKWGIRGLPDQAKLQELAATDVTESLLSENNGDRVKFQAFLLYVFAVMMLL